VAGLRCCKTVSRVRAPRRGQTTHVAARTAGYPECTASAGTSWRAGTPSGHCPVGRPCRPAAPGTGWELGHRRERSRSGEGTAARRAGNVPFGLAELDRVLAHRLDRSRYVRAPPVACVGFPPPSCAASIPCGFP
jgi:hypothetical protein